MENSFSNAKISTGGLNARRGLSYPKNIRHINNRQEDGALQSDPERMSRYLRVGTAVVLSIGWCSACFVFDGSLLLILGGPIATIPLLLKRPLTFRPRLKTRA